MKKQSLFVLVALAVLLSLALTGPAGAAGEVGFHIDCTGAYGFGTAYGDVNWVVTYWDPVAYKNWSWEGVVSGGLSGAPFDVTIPWPNPPVPGTDPDANWDEYKGQ